MTPVRGIRGLPVGRGRRRSLSSARCLPAWADEQARQSSAMRPPDIAARHRTDANVVTLPVGSGRPGAQGSGNRPASCAPAEDPDGSSNAVSVGLHEPTDLRLWRARVAPPAHAAAVDYAREDARTSPDGSVQRAPRSSTAQDDGSWLATGLIGAELPSITLQTTKQCASVDLRDLAMDWLVVYCYPGVREHEESRAEDARAHRAYRRHQEALTDRQVWVTALSSQSANAHLEESRACEIHHTVLLDPALCVADRLGLPTFLSEERRCYRRVTLLVKDRVIKHVFAPVECAARNPSQVLAWMDLHGW